MRYIDDIDNPAPRPLLTHEEEVDLARRRDNGKMTALAARRVLTLPGLPDDMARVARARVEAGESAAREAVHELANRNVRLVYRIAIRHRGRGLDLQDLAQEGYFGLLRAAEGFEWERGLRFSTYAVRWARQTVTRAVAEQGSTIARPCYIQEIDAKVGRAQRRLMAADLPDRLEDGVRAAGLAGLKKARHLADARRASACESIDHSPRDDGRTLARTLMGARMAPEAAMETEDREDLRARLKGALRALTPREREILKFRYDDALTLAEIGAKVGLHRERIRQLQSEAIAKLRGAV